MKFISIKRNLIFIGANIYSGECEIEADKIMQVICLIYRKKRNEDDLEL